MRSNEKFHQWIVDHPHLGPIIDNWNRHRAVSSMMKKRGYVLLAISFTFSFVMLPQWWLKLGVVLGFSILLFCFHRLPVHDQVANVAEPNENH